METEALQSKVLDSFKSFLELSGGRSCSALGWELACLGIQCPMPAQEELLLAEVSWQVPPPGVPGCLNSEH